MEKLVSKGGSDLHLKAGKAPLIRKGNDLKPFSDEEPLSEEDIIQGLTELLGNEIMDQLDHEYDLDTAYHMDGIARFRINIFHQLGKIGCVMRAIPLEVPTIDQLELPEILKDISMHPQGLALVTGPTGVGKSTSLAAMIQHLNTNKYRHVLTIEDPVEYVYTDAKATINQREVGNDTADFNESLRRGLRQDPDVILVGEIRDRETVEIALRAAETGHLVFSTLHTNDAQQTLDRILDMFPAGARDQVRNMLSQSLKAVISQRLVDRKNSPGQIAPMEIMIASPRVKDLIYEGDINQLRDAIKTSKDYYGMRTMNQHLAELVKEEIISKDVALETSDRPDDLKLILKGVQTGTSMIGSDIEDQLEEPPPDEQAGKQEEQQEEESSFQSDYDFGDQV